MTAGRADRRRHLRRLAGDTTWLRGARLQPGLEAVLVDLSPDGALVETANRLRPGMKTVLVLKTRDGEVRAPAGVLRAWVSRILPDRGILYRGALRFDRPIDLPGRA